MRLSPLDSVETISTLAEALVEELGSKRCAVATAESCTGGWIAKSLTDVAGSSACFGYGIVSYSNSAKDTLLNVPPATLAEFGAVSEETVTAMADGALALSGADLSVAVSGIAGPDGGTEDKPVGTVWFAWARRSNDEVAVRTERKRFPGDRNAIRARSVILALQGLREALRSNG